MRQRLSLSAIAVLRALAEGHRHGFDIIGDTGLGAATVYPTLGKLEDAGFVTSTWEDPATARRDKRPARRVLHAAPRWAPGARRRARAPPRPRPRDPPGAPAARRALRDGSADVSRSSLPARAFERGLRLLGALAPSWQREDWRNEWLAEFAAWRPRLAPAGTWRAGDLVHLLGYAAGAVWHVAWLWRREWSLDMLWSDAKYSLRSLLRQRAFTATALVTLAAGIGTVTAMFTVVDAVLIRPLPYPDPDRLALAWPEMSVSPKTLADLEARRPGFEALGGYSGWGFTLTGGARAEQVDGARVTPAALRALGVRPVAGRLIEEADAHVGSNDVALISDGLWLRRFGRDPAAVGAPLEVDGHPYRILGVMPASFEFPRAGMDLWAPLTLDASSPDYTANFATMVGRLPAGGSVAQANDEMRAYAESLRAADPKTYTDRFLRRAVVVPLHDQLVRNVRQPLVLLSIAVGLLLVIACANVANLMLVRMTSRTGELAVRRALGANAARLGRQVLVESLVLAVAGGAAGLVLARALVAWLMPLVPATLPFAGHVALDARVVVFSVGLVMACAVVFGVLPAWSAARTDIGAAMSGGRGADLAAGRGRVRTVLVFAEITVATLLAVSAVLLGRSFVRLSNVDFGFDPDHVLTLHVAAPDGKYSDDDHARVVMGDILAAVRGVPGVRAAGGIHLLPLTGNNWNPGVEVGGATAPFPGSVNWRVVTPGYFGVMHIPLVAGRDLQPTDDRRADPVAVVNEAFVRDVFGGGPAIGRRLRTFFEGGAWATVVGVVGDVRQHRADQAPLPEMYRPLAQHPMTGLQLMAATTGDPAAAAASVRAAIARVDPDIAVDGEQPMSAVVDHALGGARFPFALAAGFAGAAMTLGLVGVAGLLSFDVAQRRREIGIRLALGAAPSTIRGMIVARGLRLGAAGIAAGTVGALAGARVLRTLLYGVTPDDPLTFAVVALGFAVVIVLAAVAPAARAGRVDPIETLRGN